MNRLHKTYLHQASRQASSLHPSHPAHVLWRTTPTSASAASTRRTHLTRSNASIARTSFVPQSSDTLSISKSATRDTVYSLQILHCNHNKNLSTILLQTRNESAISSRHKFSSRISHFILPLVNLFVLLLLTCILANLTCHLRLQCALHLPLLQLACHLSSRFASHSRSSNLTCSNILSLLRAIYFVWHPSSQLAIYLLIVLYSYWKFLCSIYF